MPQKRRKPTALQRRATEILASDQNITLGEAMVKGGYSKSSSLKPKQNFTDRVGTQTAIEEMKDKLAGKGITIDFMAGKYWEWLNAKKIKGSMTEPDKIVEDYETQLKAKDDVNRILGMGEEKAGINLNTTGPVQIVFKRQDGK
jgi:hypothetical protein